MIGVGLTRTRLSTRLGLSIGERLATLTNTLADSTLPISAIPGLLDRINALDDRLTALGLAAVDPDVADAIAAVLVDLAEAIDAIDLHRTLAVVLPALEAAMTQLEEAAANPNPQPTPITISGTPPTTGTVGQAYSFTPTTAGGSGTKAFTLAAGTLLGGLSFSTTTGTISGTPNVAGTMSGIVVRVADSTGSASTTATNVTIAEAGSPSGQWFANSTDIFANGTDWFADGTRSGGGSVPAITLTVGAISPGTEGSGVTGITLTVGAISPANEGTGSAITLTVGSITASGEGNPAQGITLTVGAISAASEGTPVTLTVGEIQSAAEGN